MRSWQRFTHYERGIYMPEYVEKEKLLERVAGIELHVSFGRSPGKRFLRKH